MDDRMRADLEKSVDLTRLVPPSSPEAANKVMMDTLHAPATRYNQAEQDFTEDLTLASMVTIDSKISSPLVGTFLELSLRSTFEVVRESEASAGWDASHVQAPYDIYPASSGHVAALGATIAAGGDRTAVAIYVAPHRSATIAAIEIEEQCAPADRLDEKLQVVHDRAVEAFDGSTDCPQCLTKPSFASVAASGGASRPAHRGGTAGGSPGQQRAADTGRVWCLYDKLHPQQDSDQACASTQHVFGGDAASTVLSRGYVTLLRHMAADPSRQIVSSSPLRRDQVKQLEDLKVQLLASISKTVADCGCVVFDAKVAAASAAPAGVPARFRCARSFLAVLAVLTRAGADPGLPIVLIAPSSEGIGGVPVAATLHAFRANLPMAFDAAARGIVQRDRTLIASGNYTIRTIFVGFDEAGHPIFKQVRNNSRSRSKRQPDRAASDPTRHSDCHRLSTRTSCRRSRTLGTSSW